MFESLGYDSSGDSSRSRACTSPRAGAGSWSVCSSVLCLLLVAGCSLVLSAQPALAHTSLVSTTPASGAVAVDPAEVALEFSQPVSPRQVQVVVTGPDGGDVGDGPARVSGRTVSRSVRAWPTSGSVRLAYRVLAEDGHPLTGEVAFQVALPAGGASATTTVPPEVSGAAQAPAAASPPTGTSVAPVLVAVLGGVAVVLVVGGVRAGRRAGARP